MKSGKHTRKTNVPTIDKVHYRTYPQLHRPKNDTQLVPIGIDTEALVSGECFMIATSLGDVFTPSQFPQCLFNRTYRGKTFVAYNLKYDEGALLQVLPMKKLRVLREELRVEHESFIYKIIPHKCLTISKSTNSVHFYDMLNFYEMKLEEAASTFLNEHKIDIGSKKFYPSDVLTRWEEIKVYCVRDAELVQRLAMVLLHKLQSYGVFPKKLYSVAYISFQYFRANTPYVMVRKYWEKHREVLDYAMRSYNGGKFEVTQKGTGHYWEYDIVSAYPYEIANLVDITWARVVQSKKYRRFAPYAFLKVRMKIPYDVNSPCVVRRGYVNTYPCGEIERVITKAEYEYFIAHGVDVTILNGYWLHIDNKQYPYRKEIYKLTALKRQFKIDDKPVDYHIIKIFLNSLYGKMVQLIKKGDYYEAGVSWNPIYGSIITANVRLRVTEMQQLYSTIIAVHTDSIISTQPLPITEPDEIGSFLYDCNGDGVILGSGVYQIGEKVKFRGFSVNLDLMKLIESNRKTLQLDTVRPLTWRECAFHGWEHQRINRFEKIPRKLTVNFDQKRLWLNDWQSFQDVGKRNVLSVPLIIDRSLY